MTRSDAERIVDELADAIERDDEGALRAALAGLRADPGLAIQVLSGLAKSPIVDVRDWVALNVARIAPGAAPKLLRQLLRDRNADTRSVAAEELGRTDSTAGAELRAFYLHQLKSREFFDPVQGMWGLARMRDKASLHAIREAGERERARGRHFAARTADVVAMLIDGQADEILTSLAAHDHPRTAALANAARLIASPKSSEALRRCAESAPDAECRHECDRQLQRLLAGDLT